MGDRIKSLLEIYIYIYILHQLFVCYSVQQTGHAQTPKGVYMWNAYVKTHVGILILDHADELQVYNTFHYTATNTRK